MPEEVRLALTDTGGAAREGWLAMSVAGGLLVMHAMFDAEITAACGPKASTTRTGSHVGTGRGPGR
ncbi:MAG: hypothetical protein GEV07_19955 [Streptosporangiales bacterium]|nr:hypothetical protein [Streptosporangiales bacterium]